MNKYYIPHLTLISNLYQFTLKAYRKYIIKHIHQYYKLDYMEKINKSKSYMLIKSLPYNILTDPERHIYFQRIFMEINFIPNFRKVFSIFIGSNLFRINNIDKCIFCDTNFGNENEIYHHLFTCNEYIKNNNQNINIQSCNKQYHSELLYKKYLHYFTNEKLSLSILRKNFDYSNLSEILLAISLIINTYEI